MNSTKICAALILICLVVPITVGYVLPSDESDKTGFSIDRTTDITSSLDMGSTDYGWYSGLSNNMYRYSSGTFLADTYEPTTQVGNWPYYLGAGGLVGIPFPIGVVDLSDYIPSGSTFYHSYEVDEDTSYFEAGGVRYDGFVIYQNGAVFAFETTSPKLVNITSLAESGGLVAGSDASSSGNILVTFLSANQAVDSSNGRPLYNNPTSGVVVMDETASGSPVDYYYWFNGFDNTAINMVVRLVPDVVSEGGSLSMTIGGATLIYAVDGNGNTTFGYDGVTRSIGNVSIYPYVWITVDLTEGVAECYGVTGMEFPATSAASLGEPITYEISASGSFTSISMDSDGGDSLYYVHRTYSSESESGGLTGATIEPSDYTGVGTYWGISLPSIASLGATIVLGETNGDSVSLTVDGGMIQPDPSIGLTKAVDVSTLSIMKVPNSNGETSLLLQGNAIDVGFDVDYVELMGPWDARVYLSTISTNTYTSYDWLPGSFGLDMDGFCTVGLMTAILGLIGAVLYQRRTGSGMALVMLTTGAIGAVYMVLLMG